MKAFIAFSTLLALALADQSSHQSVKHGNAPAVTPDEVHQYHNEEKYVASAHAPAHAPVHAPVHHAIGHHGHHAPVYHPAPVHHAPVYHPAPVYHKPAPVYHKPAPVYHPAPAPAYKPAPVPAYKPAIVHPVAPAYKPAHPAPAYHEPSYDEPAVYQYGYAVADDYSGANFAQNENRDGYATTGEYRVALPDGRTQIVTYSVGDAYSGYVADVKYEGEATYPVYEPKKPAYKPAPYHA